MRAAWKVGQRSPTPGPHSSSSFKNDPEALTARSLTPKPTDFGARGRPHAFLTAEDTGARLKVAQPALWAQPAVRPEFCPHTPGFLQQNPCWVSAVAGAGGQRRPCSWGCSGVRRAWAGGGVQGQLPSVLEKAPTAGGEGRDGDCVATGGGGGAISHGLRTWGPGHSTRGGGGGGPAEGCGQACVGAARHRQPPQRCARTWIRMCLHHSPAVHPPDQEPGAISSPLSLAQSCPWLASAACPSQSSPGSPLQVAAACCRIPAGATVCSLHRSVGQTTHPPAQLPAARASHKEGNPRPHIIARGTCLNPSPPPAPLALCPFLWKQLYPQSLRVLPRCALLCRLPPPVQSRDLLL